MTPELQPALTRTACSKPLPWLAGKVRTRWLLFPREHGAWGMLLVPVVTGAWIARPTLSQYPALILFSFLCLSLFCLRTPLEVSLGVSPLRAQTPNEKQAVLRGLVFHSALAAVCLLLLLRTVPIRGLLLLAAPAVGSFVVQLVLRRSCRKFRVIPQVTGAIGLTSTAAGAYFVVTGQLGLRAALLWATNWIFVLNQVTFVHLRIRAARALNLAERIRHGRGFLVVQGLMVLALGLACSKGALPALALLALAPVWLRGWLWFILEPKPLEIRRLGKSELAHALAFGSLLIIGFRS